MVSTLYNRKKIVKYNRVHSEEVMIKSGVPQGLVLGPILFLLYVNDIQYCSELISIVLFADDTNTLYSNMCLKSRFQWLLCMCDKFDLMSNLILQS